jgi:hypothetical protein
MPNLSNPMEARAFIGLQFLKISSMDTCARRDFAILFLEDADLAEVNALIAVFEDKYARNPIDYLQMLAYNSDSINAYIDVPQQDPNDTHRVYLYELRRDLLEVSRGIALIIRKKFLMSIRSG